MRDINIAPFNDNDPTFLAPDATDFPVALAVALAPAPVIYPVLLAAEIVAVKLAVRP